MDRQDRLGISDHLNVTPEILARDNVELVFEGLDTYAIFFSTMNPC